MGNEAHVANASLVDRVVSVDVFRGVTILAMLFVNDLNDEDLGNVQGVPQWLNHMPAGVDGMTFVDAIFPAFLFITGVSIPLAFAKHFERGKSSLGMYAHVFKRSLGLIVVGLCMTNTYSFHPTAMVISPGMWEFLFFIAVILIWNRYPAAKGCEKAVEDRNKRVFAGLRLLGAVVFVALVVVFRGNYDGQVTWMRTSWWGILTGIGVAYLIASSAYFLLRNEIAGMVGVLALLTAFNIGDSAGLLEFLDPVRKYVPIGGFVAGLSSITVAGVIAGMLFRGDSAIHASRERIRWLLVFSVGLYVGGSILRPLHGISKLAETPAWCLVSSAYCCGIFVFLHWLIDLKRITKWAQFVRPAGTQALLAYILPHIIYSLFLILGIEVFKEHMNAGFPGIVRSGVFALVTIALTGVLSRRLRIDLRL